MEWVAISFYRGSSQHRNQIWISYTAGAMREAMREAQNNQRGQIFSLVPFYRREKGDTKRLQDLPKDTYQRSGSVETRHSDPIALAFNEVHLIFIFTTLHWMLYFFQRYTLNPTSSSKSFCQFPITNFSEFPRPLICITHASIRDNATYIFVFPLPP